MYDGHKIESNPQYFKKIIKLKYVYKGEGISCNPQRNYALGITNPNTLLNYLNDDNILHPNSYKLLDTTENDKIYTFDEYNRLKGNDISVGCTTYAN